MSVVERAIAIAVEAHANQLDKVGNPYVTHPLRVMSKLETDLERIVAVLHDVVEDNSDWTFERLKAEGIPQEAIDALSRVTLPPEEKEDYDSFIERTAGHPVSRRVKIADLEDNMDLRRLPEITDRDVARLRKYLKAWRRLKLEK